MATVRAIKIDETEGLLAEIPSTDDLAALAGAAFTGNVQLSGGAEILGLPAVPTTGDAATSKDYVDGLVEGLSVVQSCLVRTDGEIDNTWGTAGSGVGKTITSPDNNTSNNDIDGVTLTVGDRVLVADYDGNATDANNGIYEVTQVADGASNPLVLTRATDFDGSPAGEVSDGKTTWIGEGTAYADTRWTLVTNDPITVDTTALLFTQTAGAGTIVGGPGIDVTANVASVDLATNPGLEFDVVGNGGALQVQVDPAGAVLRGASGLSVQVGDGIEITGNALAVDLAGTNPGLQFVTGELAVLPDPAGAIVVGAAGIAANVDGVTIQINGSNQLEVLGAGDSMRVADTVTAQENLNLADPVENGTVADQYRQCRANDQTRIDCQGVVEEAGGISAAASGTVVFRGPAYGVLSGATPGARYYVADAGGLTATYGSISAGSWVIVVGNAINATDLMVRPLIVVRKE